tara:strand:- start:455 stop:1420 length:966 start_codon:yes stop_codon:yes gene_type:complete
MGTRYTVKYIGSKLNETRGQVQKKIDHLLVDINQEMSTYIPDSEISQLNKNQSVDWIKLSPRLFTVLATAKLVSDLSNGAFDVTIGPLVNLWGFGPDGEREVPNKAEIDRTKQLVGFSHLQMDVDRQSIKKIHPDIYIDLSAIAKGYGVDLIGQLLIQLEIRNYMVDIGGEVKTKGLKNGEPWQIGIEKPDPIARTIHKILEISDMNVATSGGYRNFFESGGKKFSHTIDPQTGYPVEHRLVSVTVFDPESCMAADALATTLMVLGPESGMEFVQKNDVAAYFIYGVQKSSGAKLREAVSPKLKFFYPDTFVETRSEIVYN